MKISLHLAVLSLFLGGCCVGHQRVAPWADEKNVKIVRLSANVDGTGKFVFTSSSVRYQHLNWQPPTDVTFDGQPWENLDQTPPAWTDNGRQLNLSRARIVKREGRDVIALEHTADGFDLYFADSPGGADRY